MADKPGRGSDQFPLRLPDGMRDRIKERAENNGRSMNAEIISRLEKSLEREEIAAGLGSLSPPDAIPETDFDRDVAAAIGKAVRSVLRSHGMNPVGYEELTKGEE
jgi:hypothetical protein